MNAPRRQEKAKRELELKTERVLEDFGIALKRQAGNIDAVAGMDRKVRNRCR